MMDEINKVVEKFRELKQLEMESGVEVEYFVLIPLYFYQLLFTEWINSEMAFGL